jgi:hypothetical protein
MDSEEKRVIRCTPYVSFVTCHAILSSLSMRCVLLVALFAASVLLCWSRIGSIDRPISTSGQAYLNTSRANQHRRTKNSELLQLFTLAQLTVRRQDTRKAGCCVCSLESRPHLSFPQPNSSRRHSKPDIQQKECEVSEQPTEEV